MDEAFADADIVYPKSWAPYAVMGRRTELLRAKDHDGLSELEQECLAQNAGYKDWECTAEKMAATKGGEALYMHCLPADITDVSCEAGEVSAEVFEKYRVATYQEASYKPFVIAALMLTGCCLGLVDGLGGSAWNDAAGGTGAAMPFIGAAAAATLLGQIRLHGVRHESEAHRAVTPVVHAYILALAGLTVLARPGWALALTVFYGAFLVFMVIVVDLLYGWIDPRVRLE